MPSKYSGRTGSDNLTDFVDLEKLMKEVIKSFNRALKDIYHEV